MIETDLVSKIPSHTLQAKKRLEFNGLLLPEEGMELTVNLTKYQIVPLFWVEEGFTGKYYTGLRIKTRKKWRKS